jgi:hypothetical protein
MTPEGLRAIETIAVGDQVLAWNPESGETSTQTVTALIRPEPKLIWRLEARDGDGETEIFHVTDDHPWFVEGEGWVETQHLRAGQRIETADDRGLTILDIARTDRVERTYNLEVDGPHTFLVGEDGAVVHNACFNWARNILRHIFTNKPGHVNPATLASQQRYARLFESVGSNPANLRGTNQFGVSTYTQNFRNGQVWVEVRPNGQIRSAGVNPPGSYR